MREALDKNALELAEEAQHKKVAVMLIAGSKVSEIARELKTTTYKINNIMKTDVFKDHLKDVTDKLVTTAANSWKSAMADRVSEAMRVIDFHLKQNDLEAVKLIVRTLGIESAVKGPEQQANLTVVLPDFNPKPKDVPNDIIEV